MSESSSGNYTKPGLRERIKSQVMAGTDGGKPGQWSARKAQLVAQKYKERGGGYKGGKTEAQKSLSKWTDQKWTTSDGKPAERKGGTTRYLPEKAWSKLSPSERSATNAKKREGSREGRQFVPNTEAAAEARKEAGYMDAIEIKLAAENYALAMFGLQKSAGAASNLLGRGLLAAPNFFAGKGTRQMMGRIGGAVGGAGGGLAGAAIGGVTGAMNAQEGDRLGGALRGAAAGGALGGVGGMLGGRALGRQGAVQLRAMGQGQAMRDLRGVLRAAGS